MPFTRLTHWYGRRRLSDPAYRFLFDTPPEGEAVVFDCEASSLDVGAAELLSIGAVRVSGNDILTSQRLELLVRPEAAIEAKTITVHQLRHMDVADGLPVREALERFLHFIGPRTLVGYYLEYDVGLVNKYLKPWLGIRLPNPQLDVSGLYYDWRMRKLRHHPTIGNVDLRFTAILGELGLPERAQHDAYNDALMTATMYLALKARMGM